MPQLGERVDPRFALDAEIHRVCHLLHAGAEAFVCIVE
jgi:hypothetical protein